MIKINKDLLFAELKRTWSPVKIIIILVFMLIFSSLGFLVDLTGAFDSEVGFLMNLSYSFLYDAMLGFVLPLSVFFICAGIIAFDVKNHWFRTILSKPITRQDFLLTKILSGSISVISILIIIVLIPIIVADVFTAASISFDFYSFAIVFISYSLQAILYVIIAAWLSLFLPSFVNIFVFAVWMLIDNTLSVVVGQFFWDKKAIQIIQEFLYPDGFTNLSSKVVTNSGLFPLEDLFWGLAALFGFLLLAAVQINYINIDKDND